MKLLRLRFVRLPPRSVQVSDTVDISLCLCDDYGDVQFLPLPVQVSLSLVSFSLSPPGAASVNTSEHPVREISFTPQKAEIHHVFKPEVPLKATFQIASTNWESSGGERTVCIKVVGVANSTSPTVQRLCGFVPNSSLFTDVDSNEQYVILSTYSGPITLNTKKTSKVKVQHHLKLFTSPPTLACPWSIVIEETIHHAISTGSKVWDGSIILSLLLLFKFNDLVLSTMPVRKRITVIELGCGCGLLSIVALRLLAEFGKHGKVVCTDEEETVNEVDVDRYTLRNLHRESEGDKDPTPSSTIDFQKLSLSWGSLNSNVQEILLGEDDSIPLILASDVQYNPDYHQPLVTTIKEIVHASMSGSNENEEGTTVTKGFCLIAYRHRTAGDDGLFALARANGLETFKIEQWGEVEIWRIN